MFREWLNAAATSVGFFTGMTYWHEMPARHAVAVRKVSPAQKEPTVQDRLGFAPLFKNAAD